MSNHEPKPVKIDASQGYEQSDVRVSGVAVFIGSIVIFLVASFALTFGIGKVINSRMEKEDGPNNRWTKAPDVRNLGNLATSPELQTKVGELTKQLPTPRLQADQGDGADDLVDLHQREDLLLNHYSWVDQAQGKVRIPIDRAIDLIAERGLPVAPQNATPTPLLTGAEAIKVTKPLTSGFARTGYEQAVGEKEAVDAQRLGRAHQGN